MHGGLQCCTTFEVCPYPGITNQLTTSEKNLEKRTLWYICQSIEQSKDEGIRECMECLRSDSDLLIEHFIPIVDIGDGLIFVIRLLPFDFAHTTA